MPCFLRSSKLHHTHIHDQTATERRINDNFRTIFRALNNNDISLRSSRAVHNDAHSGKGRGNRGLRGDDRTVQVGILAMI
ncbi:hypothetical protein DPMN_051955 [Dreissena polymorpha]|uniref:Uncharacterized protein n=1 Tax=Dreissena polymorpha TaxID=45954 RepID=A0A9D4HNU7_DREPO|nr:hypothetical protein DPMN_051955 [Dreissena polymorpha]